MADSLNSSNNSLCSVFDTYDYVIVAAVSSGSAMVSALCCIFVIGLIFLFKKQYSFIQRLIFYHCLATLLRSLSTMLRLHRLGYRSESEAINILCALSGFTNQLTSWFLIMDYILVTFTLLMLAVSRKNVARLEALYVVLIFVFPLTFNWIPFIHHSYGRAGAWCGIRQINYDCTEYSFGVTLKLILQTVPQYTLAVLVLLTLTFILTFLAYQKYCKWGRHKYKEHVSKEVWPLMFYPFGVILLNIVPLINRVYELINADDPSYALWIISAILSPLQGGYIALVYTLDRDTLRRLSYSNLVATFCRMQDDVHEYPVEDVAISDSMKDNVTFQDSQKKLKA